jgi:hypothetical protein
MVKLSVAAPATVFAALLVTNIRLTTQDMLLNVIQTQSDATNWRLMT